MLKCAKKKKKAVQRKKKGLAVNSVLVHGFQVISEYANQNLRQSPHVHSFAVSRIWPCS
jgi:hypothetical protein